jgi:hypothetical protein
MLVPESLAKLCKVSLAVEAEKQSSVTVAAAATADD